MPRSEADLAWLAGIYEGEGSVFLKGTSSRYNGEKNAPYIKIAMIDEDIIQRVQRVAGFGTMSSYILKSGKRIYQWHSGDREQVPQLLRAMSPWLGERRMEQVRIVLAGAKPYGWDGTNRSQPGTWNRVIIHA